MPNTHPTLASLFSDTADAIREKTGSSADIVADNFPTEIRNIPAGIQIAEIKDVNFFDYDGTCLYSYTAAEASALTALPDAPNNHTGLTSTGWNWTLSDMKTQVQQMGECDIGATYITDDGKTRLYIRIEKTSDLTVPLTWYQSAANGAIIDWGDGSATETFSGNTVSTTHTYSAVGEYVITMNPSTTSIKLRIGNNASNTGVLGQILASGQLTSPQSQRLLYKVEIGKQVTRFNNLAFGWCMNLESITIPNNTVIDYLSTSSVFIFCTALKCIIIPPLASNATGTYFAASCFQYCTSLKVLSIPKGITAMSSATFADCCSIERIVFPTTFTGLLSTASAASAALFNNNRALKKLNLSKFTYIGFGANFLSNGYRIEEVVLPSNVGMTTSGSTQFTSAFSQCRNVRKITLPSAMQYAGQTMFDYCGSLEELHVTATTPPTLGTNALRGIPSTCKIYVPSASVSSYQTAWSAVSSQIQAEPS